jgi:hypothetical protein
MRWRDIRFEKPTKSDANACGRILQILNCGAVGIYSRTDLVAAIAWMPLSELPQPDLPGPIPDGWRAVDKAVGKKRPDEMFWLKGSWRPTSRNDEWDSDAYYIVPIDPPAPQYRPFANAAEWWPNRDRWVRNGLDRVKACWFGQQDADARFKNGCVFLNDDGTDAEPFGVKVETN